MEELKEKRIFGFQIEKEPFESKNKNAKSLIFLSEGSSEIEDYFEQKCTLEDFMNNDISLSHMNLFVETVYNFHKFTAFQDLFEHKLDAEKINEINDNLKLLKIVESYEKNIYISQLLYKDKHVTYFVKSCLYEGTFLEDDSILELFSDYINSYDFKIFNSEQIEKIKTSLNFSLFKRNTRADISYTSK